MNKLHQLPSPASRHARALLRFPDPRTDWVVVTVATLAAPLDRPTLHARLAELHRAVPMAGARLQGETWVPATTATPLGIDGEPLDDPRLDQPFDLAVEAPLRLVLGRGGFRLAVVGHHAAFDGLALVAILESLTGGSLPGPVASPPSGEAGSKLALLSRLARPADAVAATPGVWPGDAYATEVVSVTGKGVTSAITDACVAAVVAHNAASGKRLRRVGITVAVGGPVGVGNVASYRRVDLAADGPVASLVQAALVSPLEPGEQVSAPKALMALLAPLVERFSDTILVSNLGRHDLFGVTRLDFFPVARGRSAVCFASASIAGGETTLTIRARDLSPGAARRLLGDAAARLARRTATPLA